MLLAKWTGKFSLLLASCSLACCTGNNDAGGSATESLTTLHSDLVIRCNKTSSSISNEVFSQAGDLLMHLSTSLERVDGKTVLAAFWTIHRSDGLSSDEVRAPASELLTCSQANEFAYQIYSGQEKMHASDETPYDNWGCDIPFIQPVVSCSPKGGCCDEHDACYALNGCQAGPTWAHTVACSAVGEADGLPVDPVTHLVLDPNYPCYNRCDLCNVFAGLCFVGPTIPGPSVCCNPTCYICGRPRNPVAPFGCIDNCMCQPNGICIYSYGGCCYPSTSCDGLCGSVPDGCGGSIWCGPCGCPCGDCAGGCGCCSSDYYCDASDTCVRWQD